MSFLVFNFQLSLLLSILTSMSVFIDYCALQKKLLLPRLGAALLCGCTCRYLGSSLIMCPFSKTVIGFPTRAYDFTSHRPGLETRHGFPPTE